MPNLRKGYMDSVRRLIQEQQERWRAERLEFDRSRQQEKKET